MSLSRPVKFPLLKLPWLCVKCFLHNLDEFVVIYFATISKRTRRIVRSSNYPLKEIEVGLIECMISFKFQLGKTEDTKSWYFINEKKPYDSKLLLKISSQPFRTNAFHESWGVYYLHSYTTGDKLDALQMGIEFMIDVFGCTIRELNVHGDKLSVLFGLANFSCDPQIFNCRRLYFDGRNSANWVTFDVLCQFDVPQLTFWSHWFSVKDIVSYVTYWFNSKNRKFEYLHIEFNNPISLEDFKLDHLNPIPFCEKRRNRWTLNKSWEKTDMSSGKDILRKDGLLATLFVKSTTVIFYIWHERFPDAV